jgi:hypothetical protein
MKPTQEQVIAWAREAGIGWLERAEGISEFVERFSTFAYEAGRKDENDACEKLHEEMWAASVSADSTVEAFNGALKGYARAIRARREQ